MIPHELSLIKLLLVYEEWATARNRGFSISDFPKDLQPLFSCVDVFHQTNDEQVNLSVADLSNLVFAKYNKDHPFYSSVLEQLEKLDVSQATCLTLLDSILRNKKLKELSLAAYEVTEGRLSFDKFNEKLHDFTSEQNDVSKVDGLDFVDDNLELIVHETFTKPGLRWRLNTLNRMMGSLRKGDFGFLFARPESGKTTILCSETTFMAEQLEESDGPILWFNNEEQHKKVLLRLYQAALGWTLPQILSNVPKAQQEYTKLTRGKLKMVNQSSISRQMVEAYCQKYKPSLIIKDQIDKITGFAADREDLMLGAVYQWSRELAKEYAPVIAVCQADGSGEGQKWLTMNNVANAKTSKQAEADWILGIGKINDPGYENLRFLHLSKNKLIGDQDTDPNLRHGRMEVLIQADIARYKDLHK